MVEGLSQIFIAGPPIVRYATHEDLDKEELGGWPVHGTNGLIDNVVTDEEAAYQAIARFLSYLPPHA